MRLVHKLFVGPIPVQFRRLRTSFISKVVTIVYSLLCSLPNSSMSLIYVYLIPPLTSSSTHFFILFASASRSSLYILHSPTMCVIISIVVPHGHIVVATSSSRLLVDLLLRVGKSRSPHETAVSAFKRSPLGRADTFQSLYIASTTRISLSFLPFHIFLGDNLCISSISSFTSFVLYPPIFSTDCTCS